MRQKTYRWWMILAAMFGLALGCNFSPQPTPIETMPATPGLQHGLSATASQPAPTLRTPTPSETPPEARPVCVSPAGELPGLTGNFDQLPESILAFLNHGGSSASLENALEDLGVANRPLAVVAGDMTGDGLLEIVVSIFDPNSVNIPPGGMMLIYQCGDQGYTLAYRHQEDAGAHIWTLQDLAAEGKAELVFSWSSCGAHTCFEDIQIIGWDGLAFTNRLNASTAELPFAQPELRDEDGDGRMELIVSASSPGSAGAGPPRGVDWTFKYQQQSGSWDLSEVVPKASNYRIHVLHDADAAAGRGENEQALVLYQRVALDPSLQEWGEPQAEQANLGAYAMFRMVVLFHEMGQEQFAATTLRDMETRFLPDQPQFAYVQMAQLFAQRFGGDGADAACQEVSRYAEAHADQVLLPLNAFGYGNRGYTSADLCPLP